jgi:hypothetical protein
MAVRTDLELEPLPSDTFERHKWLAKALLQYREQQAPAVTGVFRSGEAGRVAVARYYCSLLEDLIPLENGVAAYEIISDGLGQPEPHWHGVRITPQGCSPISDPDRTNLATLVKNNRTSIGASVRKTHRELAAFLSEPALFCVLGKKQGERLRTTDVQFYRNGRWYPVTTQSPLPLKEKVGGRSGSVVDEIAETLSDLAKNVLWPSFWTVHPVRKYASLIAIYSSPGQDDAGVWAIHAANTDESEWEAVKLKEWTVRQAMDPPLLCLFDALATEYERNSVHERRIRDVRFFARALGIVEKHRSTEQLFRSFRPARLIYERGVARDPLKDYGALLWRVIESHLSIVVVDPKPAIAVAIEHTFVASRHALAEGGIVKAPAGEPTEVDGLSELLYISALRLSRPVDSGRTEDDLHGQRVDLLEQLARRLFVDAPTLGGWLVPAVYGLMALLRLSSEERIRDSPVIGREKTEWLRSLGLLTEVPISLAATLAERYRLWPD